MPPSSRRGAVTVLAAGLVLAGCSSAVEVGIPEDADHAACTAASTQWPDTVKGELERTETDPEDPAAAAWGDPAVIARCGMPPLSPTENQCISVDGVDWVADELDDGTRLTTFGRDPAIEVIVPEEHTPAPLILPAFSDAAKELPRNDYSCS